MLSPSNKDKVHFGSASGKSLIHLLSYQPFVLTAWPTAGFAQDM
jgi:hypothetical protein